MRADVFIRFRLDGYSLDEALSIIESPETIMNVVRKNEPEKLAWHPVATTSDTPAKKPDDEDQPDDGNAKKAAFFNSDLDSDTSRKFQWPQDGKYRANRNYPLIKAHYGQGEYSSTEKAPTPTGRVSNRDRPEVSKDHIDFLTHAASHASDGESHWYEHIKPLIRSVFDSDQFQDSHMMLSLLAAGSPQTHPHLNVMKSMRAYRDLIQGRPLVGVRGETDNYVRAAHGLDLSGPKVNAYAKNIHGDLTIPTNDRHMKYANLSDYHSGDNIHPEQHAAIAQATQAVARNMGVHNAEAQAAIWHHHIRRAGLNHPDFHEPNSPFRHYSTEYGGWLHPTEHVNPVQDYGQFIRHPGNLEALTHIKKTMDQYRMDHPHFSRMAGSGKPFLFSPDGHGGATKYGADISDTEFKSAVGQDATSTMIDLGNRDISTIDTVTGWPRNPTKGNMDKNNKSPAKVNFLKTEHFMPHPIRDAPMDTKKRVAKAIRAGLKARALKSHPKAHAQIMKTQRPVKEEDDNPFAGKSDQTLDMGRDFSKLQERGWVEPGGKFHSINGMQTHWGWARKNMDKVPDSHRAHFGKCLSDDFGGPVDCSDAPKCSHTIDTLITRLRMTHNGWIRKIHNDLYDAHPNSWGNVVKHVREHHPELKTVNVLHANNSDYEEADIAVKSGRLNHAVALSNDTSSSNTTMLDVETGKVLHQRILPETRVDQLIYAALNEGTKRLIMMRGLPGSGKSHRAKQLAAGDPTTQIFSTDDYWGKNYNFDPSKLGEAHAWNHARAHEAMKNGSSTVIIDNTNIEHAHMEPYHQSAQQFGYEVSHEHSQAPWAWDTAECAKRNTHGVPHDAIERMKGSYEP